MVEEIEEIMDEEVYYCDFSVFAKKAAKYLYDYFCNFMSNIADGRAEKSTGFAIDIERNVLNHDSAPCATLYRKTPEWHKLVTEVGWAFGERTTEYEDPNTLVNRYELANLEDVLCYSDERKHSDTICSTGGMTTLLHCLSDIFQDNRTDAGPIYEVTVRIHSGYGGVISIVWKK